jgi:hypothetical protein
LGGNEILEELGRALTAENTAWASFDAWALAAMTDPPMTEVPHAIH